MNRFNRAASLAAIALAAMTAPALAQEESMSTKGAGERREIGPSDIVVTAQKREERLMDVPAAVTAITGTEIEDKGYSNLSEMLQRAPGVSVTGNLIQVRGISSIFGSATVGYYLDELPFSFLINAQLPDVRAWDLERVEVLRGPQGTLYGANSIGGTVRVLTKNPDLRNVQVKGEASAGMIEDGAEQWELKGAVNVPLIQDRLAIRIAATHQEAGGFVDSPLGKDIDDGHVTTLRGKIAVAPVDGVDITLSAWSYDANRDHLTYARPNRISTNPLLNPTALDYETYGAVVNVEGPGFDVVSSTSYLELTTRTVSTAFLAGGAITTNSGVTNAETFSQELRLVSSGTGPLRWTLGGFYQDSREKASTQIPGVISGDSAGRSEAWAIFGEGTYRFGSLEATLGARYFEDQRLSSEVLVGYPVIPAVRGAYNSFNPKFNLAWHASENSLFYATIAKGFRSGQNQPSSSLFIANLFGVTVPTQIAPETLWSYELGNKTSFLDGRMTVEAAVYYNDWKDLQVTVVAGGIIGALVNAGSAHAIGADLSIAYQPIDGFSLALSGNINESIVDTTVPTAFNKGDRITNVPKYTLNASATYITPISSGLDFFGFIELQQSASRELRAQGFVGQSDPQSLLNARIGVEADNWGLYFTAQNLLDESGYAQAPLSATDFNTTVPQPRTLGVLLRANY